MKFTKFTCLTVRRKCNLVKKDWKPSNMPYSIYCGICQKPLGYTDRELGDFATGFKCKRCAHD